MPKVFIKSAAKQGTKINLSHNHVTTFDFKYYKPTLNLPLLPGDKINIDLRTKVRLSPLEVPTWGNLKFVHRAFFVPYRLVFPRWDNFLSGQYFTDAYNTSARITNVFRFSDLCLTDTRIAAGSTNLKGDIRDCLVFRWFEAQGLLTHISSSSQAYSPEVVEERQPDIYLFNIPDQWGGAGKRFSLLKWTDKGRRFMNLFISLGYPKDFFYNSVYWERDSSNLFRSRLNALPLLCYLKIFQDWLRPSQFLNTETFSFEHLFAYDGTVDMYVERTDLVDAANLVCMYDSDFYNSLQAAPNAITTSSATRTDQQIVVPHSESTGSTVAQTSYATQTNGVPISDMVLNAIKSLSDFVRRRNLSGLRWVDQSLSEFGVRPSDARIDRVEYLGSAIAPVSIGDVTSMTDNLEQGGTVLGDYGGKGWADANGKFHYESTEFGELIVISTLIPEGGFVQGFDRSLLCTSRKDFYTPEFDNMLLTPVANGEMYADNVQSDYDNIYGGNSLGIFGYAPAYYWYKRKDNKLTGDFRFSSVNSHNGLDSYHLFRMLNAPSANSPLVLNPAFVRMDDAKQYDRIFTYVSRDDEATQGIDHFYCEFTFNIQAFRPVKSLQDSLDIDGDGRIMDVEKYGSQL